MKSVKMVSCRSAPFEPCVHTRQGRLTQRCVRSASHDGLRLVHTPPSSSEKFVRMSRASPSTQSSGWLAICEVRSVVPEQEGSRRPMPNVV